VEHAVGVGEEVADARLVEDFVEPFVITALREPDPFGGLPRCFSCCSTATWICALTAFWFSISGETRAWRCT